MSSLQVVNNGIERLERPHDDVFQLVVSASDDFLPVESGLLTELNQEILEPFYPEIVKELGGVAASHVNIFNCLDDLKSDGFVTLSPEGYEITALGRSYATEYKNEQLAADVKTWADATRQASAILFRAEQVLKARHEK